MVKTVCMGALLCACVRDGFIMGQSDDSFKNIVIGAMINDIPQKFRHFKTS